MLIDCDTCVMQHTEACHDCIVSVLLAGDAGGGGSGSGGGWAVGGPHGTVVELADGETEALRNLAEVGLVAPLRLVVRHRASGEEVANG
ncbi:MAG: hypothetical protein M3349_04985 [Actinomycetota bacterium]|nr:hypothetical protein [Actinomycetota bacterium]